MKTIQNKRKSFLFSKSTYNTIYWGKAATSPRKQVMPPGNVSYQTLCCRRNIGCGFFLLKQERFSILGCKNMSSISQKRWIYDKSWAFFFLTYRGHRVTIYDVKQVEKSEVEFTRISTSPVMEISCELNTWVQCLQAGYIGDCLLDAVIAYIIGSS